MVVWAVAWGPVCLLRLAGQCLVPTLVIGAATLFGTDV